MYILYYIYTWYVYFGLRTWSVIFLPDISRSSDWPAEAEDVCPRCQASRGRVFFWRYDGVLSHGGPHKSSICRWVFPMEINQPAIGIAPWLRKPPHGEMSTVSQHPHRASLFGIVYIYICIHIVVLGCTDARSPLTKCWPVLLKTASCFPNG